jgi:hypothetical protein
MRKLTRQITSACWIACLLLGARTTLCAADYGRCISTPKEPGARLQASITDLRDYLRRISGKDFQLVTDLPGEGIILAPSPAQVPANLVEQLKGLGREPFVISSDGKERLWIVANGEAGLCHGIYFYLEQLGVRWIMPSEQWTIVPKRDDVTLRIDRLMRPAFASRMFFGTGGFGGSLPIDPKRQLQARWEAWQRRNRFGGEFLLAGHSGEAFNARFKKVLEAHPEYLAMIDGKRQSWSPIVKFCASNREVVDLFIKDRLDSLRLARKLDPHGPRAWAVSVEPSDGGGHCQCPDCLALGSPSDRVFHVANQVARAVAREFADARVSLLAYNEHAAVPKISLEKNVYVMVAPYAFQRTDLSPDQLLEAWSRKVPAMSVYDYWSIPDWNHDLPTFDYLHKGPERLRRWHALHVEGFNAESTFSGGAMGAAWYLHGKLAWDPKLDERQVLQEFYQRSFGRAKAPMQRMLERWAAGFYLTSHELGLSFRDLDEAWRLSADEPPERARVADFVRYVQYVRLRFEYLQSRPGTAERESATLALLRHGWNIYDSAMVHAFRLSQLVCRDESKRDPSLLKRYDLRDPKAVGWQEITAVSPDTLPTWIAEGKERYRPQEFVVRRFTGARMSPAVVAKRQTVSFSEVLIPNNTLDLHLQVAEARNVSLRIACEKVVRVRVTDVAGRVVLEKLVETGAKWLEEWSELTVPLPKAGDYRIQLWSPRRTFRLSVPSDVALVMEGFTNSQGRPTPRLYFYVPAGLSRLAIYASYTAAGPPRFFTSGGTEVKPQLVDGGKLLLLDVPADQSGQIWSLGQAKTPNEPLRFLNAPQAFAFFPDTLLVPLDSLQK